MKPLVSCIAFVLAVGASAQDQASVDTFFRSYERASLAGDDSWFVAHADPTFIIRSDEGLYTYSEFMKNIEESKKTPRKTTLTEMRIVAEKTEIIGNRAIVNAVMHLNDSAASPKKSVRNIRYILAWKDGDWRMWRMYETSVK